jgi:hypothetical protein
MFVLHNKQHNLFGVLADCTRGSWFDPRTVQTFVCINMSVLGLGVP